jgi:hypothetical protein
MQLGTGDQRRIVGELHDRAGTEQIPHLLPKSFACCPLERSRGRYPDGLAIRQTDLRDARRLMMA